VGDSLIKGRGLSPGDATAQAVVCDQYISPLGEISKDGFITSGPCEDTFISNTILAFRGGRGSTVGSYTFLELKNRNIAPAGLINEEAEQMVVTGAIISDIPMVDHIPLDILLKGDTVTLKGSTGEVSIANVTKKRVATVYLMHKGNLLLLKRSADATSYPGQYSGISGYLEEGETPEQTGKRETQEECNIKDAKIKATGKDIYVRSDDVLFEVTPMLMTTSRSEVKLNYENSEYLWINPKSLADYQTVPKFKETLARLIDDL
jgi:predicted aconitase with swiveling domain/8-oxo-dGTP pyrophosphatase MutT (NUDIX family)